MSGEIQVTAGYQLPTDPNAPITAGMLNQLVTNLILKLKAASVGATEIIPGSIPASAVDTNFATQLAVPQSSIGNAQLVDAPGMTLKGVLGPTSNEVADNPMTAVGAALAGTQGQQGGLQAQLVNLPGLKVNLAGDPDSNSQAAAATIFLSPQKSDRVALYNNVTTPPGWVTYLISQLQITIPNVANRKYDLFLYAANADGTTGIGTPILYLEAWTNFSTRNVTLTRINGQLVHSADNTKLFLCTVATDPTNSAIMFVSDGNTTPRVPAATPGGRLSLSTAAYDPTAVSGNALNYVPYTSDQIELYSGGVWQQFSFSTVALAGGIPGTANGMWDVFAYRDATGTVQLYLEAWSTPTTRTVALTTLNGRLVHSTDNTKRWLGTVGTDASGVGQDTPQYRLLWNAFNRRAKGMRITDTSPGTYITATWREWNGVTTKRLNFVCGEATVFQFSGHVGFSGTASGVSPAINPVLTSTPTPQWAVLSPISNPTEIQYFMAFGAATTGTGLPPAVVIGANFATLLQQGGGGSTWSEMQLEAQWEC